MMLKTYALFRKSYLLFKLKI